MQFPIHDWQFWMVTLIASVAAGWLLRGVFGKRLRRRGRLRAQTRRATLTVEGEAVARANDATKPERRT